MKKLLTIAALLGVASLSYGQGYVSFANQAGTRISNNSVPSPTGGSGTNQLQGTAASGSYYYALFVAPTTQSTVPPTGDPTASGWTFTGDYATNTGAGRFIGWGTLDTSSVQIPGYAAGSTADFLVVGWSSTVGGTWAQAQAWWNNGLPEINEAVGVLYNFGISSGGSQVLQPAGGPYNAVMGPAANGQVGGFALGSYMVVPEPTTFALAGLGAAALVIFRRRK